MAKEMFNGSAPSGVSSPDGHGQADQQSGFDGNHIPSKKEIMPKGFVGEFRSDMPVEPKELGNQHPKDANDGRGD